jgi:hypothetical protein
MTMRFLMQTIAALERWFVRRTAALDHARAPLVAALALPLLCGLLSLALGQDANWDLRNYHWYNPYALLHGRLLVDMAPAQWHSYFNPAVDVPYYLLSTSLPAPVAGFAMGLLHGLNFVLLMAIARCALGTASWRLPILLAAAGMCGAGFLSELGNTMGDNLTALFVLASLLLVLECWERLASLSMRTAAALLVAGIVMGAGTGLKLTNATYASALCLALLTVPAVPGARVAAAFTYGCGVVAGMALTVGYWWLTLWNAFGNPLFPQFNNIFHSPLAQPVGVVDNAHLPQDWIEAATWPFVFTAHFTRVSEIVLKQAILPVLYLLALLFIGRWLFERVLGKPAPARLSARARLLLVFGALAYLAWLKLFGIYRYLVPLELLAPILAWILVGRMIKPPFGGRIAGWIIALASLVVFPFATWGHADWAASGFSAQLPAIVRPASTLVFTAHGDPPMGWLASFYPPQVRVVALAGGFPETPAWRERIQAAIASRPGPHYVMLATARNPREGGLRRKLALVRALHMTSDEQSCRRLDGWLQRVRFQVQVRHTTGQAAERCTLELQPRYVLDLAAQDRAIVAAAQRDLLRYKLVLLADTCRRYPAAVGSDPYPFQLCQLRPI